METDNLRKIKIRRIALISTSLAFILWSLAIMNFKLIIGSFGLWSTVNIYMILSILLFSISFLLFLYIENYKMAVIPLFAICFVIFLFPFIVESTPRFTFSYLTYGHVDYILRTGHINPEMLVYQNWPGIMFLAGSLEQITTIGGLNLLVIYPFIIKLFTILLVYLIIIKLSGNIRLALLGSLLYLLGDWEAFHYFTPPSLGLTLYLIMILLLIYAILFNRTSGSWKVMAIIVLGSLVITHLLSAVTFCVVLIVMIIFSRYFKIKGLEEFNSRVLKMKAFAFLSFIVLTAWLFFPVGNFAAKNLPSFISNILNIFSIISATEGSITGLGPEYSIVIVVKMVYTLLFAILGVIGILLILKDKKMWRSPTIYLVLIFMLAATLVTPLLIGPYSGEIVARAFGTSTPFLAYLMVKGAGKKFFIILVIFILISPPLLIVSSYGNEKMDYVSKVELSGTFYFGQLGKSDMPIISFSPRILQYYNIENFEWKSLIFPNNGTSKEFALLNQGRIILDEQDIVSQQYSKGNIDINMVQVYLSSKYYNKVYSSAGFRIFNYIPMAL